MMSSQRRFGFVAFLVAGCFLKMVNAQLPQDPLPPDDTPFFCVGYDDQVVPVAMQPLYRQATNTLIGYNGVPNDRLNYFSAVNNNNNCLITRWQGVITNVQANCNGNLVTVQVTPSVSSSDYGPAYVVMTTDYSEQYQINNDGTFQYLGSLYTQALAGQMPDMIGV